MGVLADGREELTIELPVDVSETTFAARALRADPRGRLVVILGYYAGLIIVDLQERKDVSDRYSPHPLDLADARPTLHAHHRHSDLAFDALGERLAAAYSPGMVSVWDRDAEELAFFDSYGAQARVPLVRR